MTGFRSFCVLMACFCVLGWDALAQANYTVRDIASYAESTDATTARIKAMQQAEVEAFTKLLAQLQLPSREPPPPEVLSPMVTGYQIISEQMTAKSYRASLNVSFDPQQVQHWLSTAPLPQAAAPVAPPGGIAIQPSQAPVTTTPVTTGKIVLIPVMRSQGLWKLWDDGNRWREAWNRRLARPTAIPLSLPLGDLTDITALDVDRLVRRDRQALQQIATRYQTQEVVIAEIQPMPGTGVYDIWLEPYAFSGSARIPNTRFTLQGMEGEEALLSRAVEEALQRMGGAPAPDYVDPSMPVPLPTTAPEQVKVLIPLRHISEWSRLREHIERIPGVQPLELLAIAPYQADVMLSYRGTLSHLPPTLAKAGYRVTPYRDYWVVQSGDMK